MANEGISPLVNPIGISRPFHRISRAKVVRPANIVDADIETFVAREGFHMSAHFFVRIVDDIVSTILLDNSRLGGGPHGCNDSRVQQMRELNASQSNPPAAPVTSTVSPACSRARSMRAYQAVRYDCIIVDPTMKSTLAGRAAVIEAFATMRSAKLPNQFSQQTRSPRRNRVT
jgi:hypothetical protein